MCGILGAVAWDGTMPPVRELCRGTDLLAHRGPNGGGWWHEPGVFLGHRRLAIIDLTTGDQPMASHDGRYVITFNGEIYNYPELREELCGRGATLRTASDTEVILAGYAAWGADVVARLEGMFAFALYDRVERTVLLARDRFGEKPLLIAARDGGLAFASELAPLVAIGAGGRELDREALAGYLCLNYVPGDRTMLRGVRRLAPAEWRLYGARGVLGRARYWSPPATASGARARPVADVLDDLQDRVDRAARLALRSDVPVGLFLSGGVDSSVVAASAARLGRLDAAFCLDMATEGFSEWTGARRVAEQLNVDLVRVPFDAHVLAEFVDVCGHLDDPLADSSAMAVWTVARAAARRLKVVLSGDGGDELFAGYLTYPASRLHRRLRPLLPRAVWKAMAQAAHAVPIDDRVKVGVGYRLHRFLRAMPLDTSEAHFTWNGTWLPDDAAALLRGSGAEREAAAAALRSLAAAHRLPPSPTVDELQRADLAEYLPNDILAKVDRATMAHGLESRAPLLNRDVAELALTLPQRLRVKGTTTKIALRELCARHFGHEHAYAPKQGFSIPIHRWLRGEGRPLLTALLAPERVRAIGLLDEAVVGRAVAEHLSGRRSLGWELWGLMVLVAWYEARVASPPRAALLADPTELRAVSLPPVGTATAAHG